MSSRPIEAPEFALLQRLLSATVSGKEQLIEQVRGARVESIDNNGSLRFIFESAPKAKVTKRIPVEAQCLDSDGMWIHALLHVLNGQISELEIYKDDSSPVLREIDVREWEILPMD
ncbi:MAG: hypothetical protein O3C40_29415 [Planctomycetota bacterium]|nr:hypothetical protein [Planctomycetota bacterium]